MLGREKKALEICRILEQENISSSMAELADGKDRLMAAKAAGYKRKTQPSDECWRMVVEMLRSRE